MFDNQAGTTVKLAQGPDGNIYQLKIYPGVLSRHRPVGWQPGTKAVITATPGNGLAPLAINFSSQGSSDPDPNTTLTYAWNFGDGTTSTAANPSRTYTVNGAYNVTPHRQRWRKDRPGDDAHRRGQHGAHSHRSLTPIEQLFVQRW